MQRLRRLIRARSDAGLTLSEVIVAMMITSLVLAIMGGFFANMTRAITVGRTTRAATSAASTAVDELGKVIRAAANVTVASGSSPAIAVGSTGTHLVVLAYVDTSSASPAPSQIDFTVNAAGDLVEQRTSGVPVSNYWSFTGASTTRTYPGPFSASPSLFAYMSGTDVLPLGASGLTSAQVSSISAVAITATIANQGRAGSDPVQITTTAVMPNLGLF